MYGLFQSIGPTENLYWKRPSTRSQFQLENSKNSSHSSPSRKPEGTRSNFRTPPLATSPNVMSTLVGNLRTLGNWGGAINSNAGCFWGSRARTLHPSDPWNPLGDFKLENSS